MRRNLLALKKYSVLLILLLILLIGAVNVNGATYYSRVATGNFATLATWSTSPTGTPTNTTALQTTDIFIIQSGHNITVAANQTVESVTVNSGGTLTIGANSLTVNNTTTISGTFVCTSRTGTKTMGTVLISGGIWTDNAGETYGITGLTLSGSTFNGTSSVILNIGAGGMTVTSGTTNTFNGATITSNTGTNTINGTIIWASTSGTKTFGNVVISGGTWTSNAAETYSMTGLTLSGATINGTATGSFTIGANGLTVTTGTTNTSGAATISVTGASAINGSLTFNSATGTKTFTGNLAIASGGSLTTGNSTTVLQANFTNAGTFTAGSSPITISGTATTQSIAGFTTTGTVSMTKTAGTATFTGNVSGGAFTVNGNGGTMNLGTGLSHTFTGTITITIGTLNGGSSTLNGSGNFTHNGGTFTASTGAVNLFGTVARTLGGTVSTAFNNLQINNTAGVTLGIATTVSTLTIGDLTPASIFSDGGFVLTSTGTLNLTSGTYRLGSTTVATSFPAFSTRNIASGTTVAYQSSVAQNVSTVPNYANLTFSGGTKTTNAGTLSIGGNWTISSAAALNTNNTSVALIGNLTKTTNLTLGTGGITIGGNWTNNGGTFTSGTGAVNFNGSALQTIGGTTTTAFGILQINNAVGVKLALATTATTLTIGNSSPASIFDDGGFALTSTGTLNLTSGTYKLGSATAATNFPSFSTRTISPGTTVEYQSGVAQTVSSTPAYANLTFSGAGLKTTATGTLSIGGNWTIGSAAALQTNNTAVNLTGNLTKTANLTLGTGAVSIGGNWIDNGGTFTPGTSVVSFNNTGSDQNITGSATNQAFNSLTVAKGTSSLIIGGSTTKVTVGNTLTMTSGNINCGSGTLELGTSTAAVGTLSYTSGVIIGSFKRWIASPGSLTFPVGISSSNLNASVTFTNLTAGSLTGSFIATDPGSTGLPLSENSFSVENQFTEGYWSLVAGDGLASTNYALDLSGTGFSSYILDINTRIIKRPNSLGSWTLDGTHVTAVPPIAKRSQLNGFGEFALGAAKTYPTVTFTSASQSSVAESGTLNITAQLSATSAHNVSVPFTVNASSSASGSDYSISSSPLVIPAGSTSANIVITITPDLNDEPNETVVVNMGTPTYATQGATITHTATITDDDNAPTVSFTSASQSSAGESGSMTITAQLSVASGFPVTVPFTVNASSTATGGGVDYSISASPLTIPAGSTTANITISLNDDLLIEGNETVIVNMGNPTNASQGAIISHVATITDDEAIPTVSFTTGSQSSIAESGTMTLTIQLSAVSTLNVSVPFTVSVASTATGGGVDYTIGTSPVLINAGSTIGTITINIVPDFLDEANETVVVSMGTPTNANIGAISSHTATITDDDAAGIIVSPTSGLVTTEVGGTATFTVTLSSQPTANVSISLTSDDTTEGTVTPSSLVFTPANWNTPQSVTLQGVNDLQADGPKIYHIITGTASSTDLNYSGINPSDVTATNNDNDNAGITVNPTVITTTEASGAGHTKTFYIVLNTQPTSNVTIGLSSSNINEGTVSPSSLTFTDTDYSTQHVVTVTGVDDFIDDGDVVYTIITAPASGAEYTGIDAPDVSATNIDDDTKGITVSSISGSTTELGGTATFSVVLNSQPTAAVSIPISSSNVNEGIVSTSSLNFTTGNWNIPQVVTVTGINDFVDDGDIIYSIIIGAATGGDYAGIDAGDVSVTNVDDDTKGITVGPISGPTTEAGGSATFTIVLTSQPTASVTIGLSSSNTAEGIVSPSSVTFTAANWSTPQIVTVTGVDDQVDDGNISYTIITAAATGGDYATLNPADVTVTNIDNDTAGFTCSPSSGLVTTEAGGTATYTVKLNSQPLNDVTLVLSSNDSSEGTVAPTSLTFTSLNWNSTQSVIITGVNDPMVDGNIPYKITAVASSTDNTYNGLSAPDVLVTNNDNDVAGITVTPTTGLTTSEGGTTAEFTVVLTSQPSADVTIGISSSDISEGTVSISSLTFTNANWSTPQHVTITGVNDDIIDGNIAYTINVQAAVSGDTNYSGIDPNNVSVTNNDNDVAGIIVSPSSGLTTSEAATTDHFTLVLTAQPNSDVTVGISSSDPTEGTVSVSSVTFTSTNWSTPVDVTVTGVNDFVADGDISYTIITGLSTSADVHFNGINPDDVSVINLDDDTKGINIGALSNNISETGTSATFTIVLDSQPTASVSIGLSSDNTAEGTVSPASVTFTTTDWNTPKTITVTGVDDYIEDGDVTFNVIIAAASGGDYTGLTTSPVSVINADNDISGITLSPLSGTTSESGTSVSFSIVLTSQPVSTVTISIVSSDPGEAVVSSSSLTFDNTNWNIPKTFLATGVPDNIDDGNTPYTIGITSSSSDPNYNSYSNDVPMINLDIDVAGFTITPSSGLVTTEAGGTATFTVVLNTAPSKNVTLGLSSSDPTEGSISPTSLTFKASDWNTAQMVTITGLNDVLNDGNIAYTIITDAASSGDNSYSGLNPIDVSVTNIDLTPSISGFSPTNVCTGSGASIVITGTFFNGVTSVKINGVTASFTVNSTTQITATLPAIATTGTISVTTPTGTAVSGTQLTVNPTNTVSAASSTPTVCVNSVLTAITHTTSGATGIGTPTGLPASVTAVFSGNTITISGTPTVAGTFNYSIPLTGGCGSVNATGTITVTSSMTVTASTPQTRCINTALSPNLTHTTTLATGINQDGVAGVNGLPAGVSAHYTSNLITISGTPSVAGAFNYSIPLTGGCGTVNATGTITVTTNNTITLSSAVGTDAQTKCINTAITNITYSTVGATGATFSGLPTGVNGSWNANVVTISGTPSVAGSFNYTVTTTGGCGSNIATGTITVTANMTVTASTPQTRCINTALSPNLTHTTTLATGINQDGVAGANGLPAGVSAHYTSNLITISGTPTAAGTFNYSIPLTGGCGSVNATGTITVTTNNTITLSSAVGTDAQTKCINTAITNITYSTVGATGANFSGLPTGVNGSWNANVVTISGTPSVAGSFNYTVTTTGGCGSTIATGTITVTANMTVTASTPQTRCINTALSPNLTHTTTLATGINQDGVAGANGLPAGVSAHYTSNLITISGTPTAAGTFNYSIPLTGGCGSVNATGTITVTTNNTITLSSAVGTDAQTKCINTAITNITYSTVGATGATFSGLPTGVNGSWNANVVTISGTPSVAGSFNYTVTTTGGCGSNIATGTITVTANMTVTASTPQTRCINTALSPNLTHTTTLATGINQDGVAGANGLPAGVSAHYTSNLITISGTPTAAGTFNYSIPLTGGCGSVNATGTITVTSDNTAGTPSSTPTLCINTALTSITISTTGATGIGTATGLPAGVLATWASNLITISGIPTAGGTFNYSIPLTGGCGTVYATGTITVTSVNAVSTASSTPTLCVNTVLTAITHTTTGATGIGTPTGLPAGVTAAFSGNTITISGTPTTTAGSPFNYSIPLSGGCGTVNATGTITVLPLVHTNKISQP